MADSPQSPTALVMAYLASKGLQPTGANVSAALRNNASNPGIIPGLTNQAPPEPDAPSKIGKPSMQTIAKKQGGQLAAPKEELPVPPPQAPVPQAQAQAPAPGAQVPGPQASPQSDDWVSRMMQYILGGGAAVGGAAGIAKGFAGTDSPMPNMSMPSRGPVDVDAPGLPSPALQLPAPQLQLQGPQQGAEAMPVPPQQAQVSGAVPGGQPQLPAPGERPAIPMPNETSGPTIPLPHRSATAEPLDMSKIPMQEGMDWGKILGEIMPLIKRVVH